MSQYPWGLDATILASRELFDLSRISSESIVAETPFVLASKLGQMFPHELESPAKLHNERSSLGMRLVADALLASQLLEDQIPEWLVNSDLESIVRERGTYGMSRQNLEYALLDLPDWVILIPFGIEQEGGAVKLENLLNDLEHRFISPRNWAIDLTGVTNLSAELVAYFIGFNATLRRFGHKLVLEWLLCSALSPTLMPSMERHFAVKKRGVYYLSYAKKFEPHDQ